MDIKELKKAIENKTIDNKLLIMKYSDNSFLCKHYVENIAQVRNKTIIYIKSINDIGTDDSFFDEEPNYLYVIETDKFTEYPDKTITDLIIIAKDLPNNLEVDYIDIPKLERWQIGDYLKMRLQGLDENQVRWLCDIAKYDIYRLDNECKKLELFNKAQQKNIFDAENRDNSFCDLNSLTIFNFTNAFYKKDYATLSEILCNLKFIDIEGTGLITLFHNGLRNLIDIQMNPKLGAAELGLSPKQYTAIKYNVGKFSNEQLIDMFEFITSLDMKLKNGDLQFKLGNRENNQSLVEYIITNLLVLGR